MEEVAEELKCDRQHSKGRNVGGQPATPLQRPPATHLPRLHSTIRSALISLLPSLPARRLPQWTTLLLSPPLNCSSVQHQPGAMSRLHPVSSSSSSTRPQRPAAASPAAVTPVRARPSATTAAAKPAALASAKPASSSRPAPSTAAAAASSARAAVPVTDACDSDDDFTPMSVPTRSPTAAAAAASRPTIPAALVREREAERAAAAGFNSESVMMSPTGSDPDDDDGADIEEGRRLHEKLRRLFLPRPPAPRRCPPAPLRPFERRVGVR